MALKADHKYTGRVAAGSGPMETQTGTPGFQVMLECEDGKAQFVIWLTEKNRARALKSFEALCVDQSKLTDANFLEYELGQEIEGREVSFGTKEETYNGKTSIKVSWIGRKSEGRPSQSVAKFFGGKVESDKPIGDDDIPF